MKKALPLGELASECETERASPWPGDCFTVISSGFCQRAAIAEQLVPR